MDRIIDGIIYDCKNEDDDDKLIATTSNISISESLNSSIESNTKTIVNSIETNTNKVIDTISKINEHNNELIYSDTMKSGNTINIYSSYIHIIKPNKDNIIIPFNKIIRLSSEIEDVRYDGDSWFSENAYGKRWWIFMKTTDGENFWYKYDEIIIPSKIYKSYKWFKYFKYSINNPEINTFNEKYKSQINSITTKFNDFFNKINQEFIKNN